MQHLFTKLILKILITYPMYLKFSASPKEKLCTPSTCLNSFPSVSKPTALKETNLLLSLL